MKRSTKYLIVGQGLAGTVLAHTLDSKGIDYILIDVPTPGSASKVAAGIFNPIAFRYLTKSWKADDLMPGVPAAYHEMEQKFGGEFVHRLSMNRIFSKPEERKFWEKKRQRPDFSVFMAPAADGDHLPLETPEGVGTVKLTGWIDVPGMLTLGRHWLKTQQRLIEAEVQYEQFSANQGGVQWEKGDDSIKAQKVIFCEGTRLLRNPWFNWLPMVPAKGELLTIRIPGIKVEHMVHKGIFIVPRENDEYWAGATYAWGDLTPDITEDAQQKLKDKLQKVIGRPFEVVDRLVGIRPTVEDRRPLIGMHPLQKTLAVFNGLGTKGVPLVHHFANELMMHLTEGHPLNSEADILRFSNLCPAEFHWIR